MADYLLKSVLYITPLKKSTLSIFTLHFLFNLLSQKLEKNYAHYILCHIILKLIKCGCASAIENNSKKKILFQYSATITMPRKKFCASWFCNPKPWL